MSTETLPAESPAPQRRRRWPKVVIALLVVLVLLFVGVLWYVSGLLGAALKIERPTLPENLTITEATAEKVSYTETEAEGAWTDAGLMAIDSTAGGWVETGEPSGTNPVTRPVAKDVNPPPLRAGTTARLDGNYFFQDPEAGLGMPFDELDIQTPEGPAPAWFVPGDPDEKTWVIFTHGRGADRTEGLRALSTTGRMGYPTLLITYLNDEGAPQGNGYGQIGVAEWPYLEAAAQYALDNGAQRLFLVGNSMGGAITLSFLKNSELAADVQGVFLDSPVASFSQAVDLNAQTMGVPAFITSAAKLMARARFGSDFAAADYTAFAASYTQPMIVVAGTEDTLIPPVVGEDFVAAVNEAHPGTAEFELFPGAEHTAEWNVDRDRYDRLLGGLLARTSN